MSHGFFSVTFSAHHYLNPFTCPCHCGEREEKAVEFEGTDRFVDHSLSTSQKVFVVAATILVGCLTYGIGSIPTFFLLAAALKARNVVWIDHVTINQDASGGSWYWVTPHWWGVNIIYRTRGDYEGHSGAPRREWNSPSKQKERVNLGGREDRRDIERRNGGGGIPYTPPRRPLERPTNPNPARDVRRGDPGVPARGVGGGDRREERRTPERVANPDPVRDRGRGEPARGVGGGDRNVGVGNRGVPARDGVGARKRLEF